MKKKWKHLLVGAIFLFCANAQAASPQVEVTIPIQQQIQINGTGAQKPDATGIYELRATEQDTPMPEGTKEDVYRLELQGMDVKQEIVFSYHHAGVYEYQLEQVDQKLPGYQYDSTVYKIYIYVKNAPEGSLLSEVVVEKEDGSKCAKVLFQNQYGNDKQPEHIQTGDQVKIGGLVLLTIVAAGGIVLFLYRRKRK